MRVPAGHKCHALKGESTQCNKWDISQRQEQIKGDQLRAMKQPGFRNNGTIYTRLAGKKPDHKLGGLKQ